MAACKVACALSLGFHTFFHLRKKTFMQLLTSCSATLGAACSLMQRLCSAAARLGPSDQQPVAASLAAAAEEVLTAFGEALRIVVTMLGDSTVPPVPPALKPAALAILLKDIADVVQFVGAAAGVYMCLAVRLS